MGYELKKKVAFIITRKNYLKFLSGYIYDQLEENDVYLFNDQRTAKDNFKWRDLPDLEIFERFKGAKIISFINNQKLKKIIEVNSIDEVYSLQPMNYFDLDKKNKNYKWIICQHGIDLFYYMNDLNNCDQINFYSNYFIDKFRELTKDKPKKYSHIKLNRVGNKQLELVKSLDEKIICQKYDLPNNKDIVIFFPLGQPSLYLYSSVFSKIFLKLFYIIPDTKSFFYKPVLNFQFFLSFFFINEFRVLREISDYVKKNNKFLILKSRSKRVFGKETLKYVDRIIYDEEYYPSTILNLLKISTESFSYYSTLASEVVAVDKTRHISIYHSSSFFDDLDEKIYNKFLDKDYFELKPRMSLIDRKKFPQIIRNKTSQKFESDIDIKNKEKYFEKYIGIK